MEELLARGRQSAANGGGHAVKAHAVMTAWEAERAVDGLRRHGVEAVGTAAWFEQHDALQQLNLQAHVNAQTHSDEFVKAAFLASDGKVPLLVHELLVAEAWREAAFPLLAPHLASALDGIATYQLPYHEVALSNLLEVLLFHGDVLEAAGEEALLELADWAARKVAYLGSAAAREDAGRDAGAGLAALLERGPEAELAAQEREVRLGAALCGLTILRYLEEHAEGASLGLLARIAGGHDLPLALPPLLESPPWLRRGAGGRAERFADGRWQRVAPEEAGALGQPEAQAWLLLRGLLVSPAARGKLRLSEARQEALLRAKRRITPLLLDQLPVLRDLQRVLEEMAFGLWDAQPGGHPSHSVIVEQVPGMRSAILRGVDWPALAERQRRAQFGGGGAALSAQRLQRMLRGIDLLSELEEEGPPQQVDEGRVKVDAYRRVKGEAWEWWASYTLDLNPDKPAEAVAVPAAAAAADENTPQQAQRGAAEEPAAAARLVKGRRHRLLPLGCDGGDRALPGDAKLSVLYGGRSCEALLQLPTSDTRDTGALPPALWVTAGGLLAHGLTLQLKVRRLERPTERDGALGVWYPYVPASGALTVRVDG